MDVELSCADSNNDHIAQRKVGITYLRHGGQQLFCLVKCFKQNAVCCLVRPRSMVIERSVCDDDGPDDGCGQWQASRRTGAVVGPALLPCALPGNSHLCIHNKREHRTTTVLA